MVTPKTLLERACRKCSLDDCINGIGMDASITEKSKVIHSLVHMTSEPPFTNSSVRYASKTALNIIFRQKTIESKRKMKGLIASCDGNPLTAALCGYIFEQYAIELLERGGEFTCRRLVHGNTIMQPNETTLDIPPSEKIIVDRVLGDQIVNQQLYVPKANNYVAIDAWIPGIGAFQMTVRKKHGINDRAIGNLVMLGGGQQALLGSPSRTLPLVHQKITLYY